MKYAGLLLTWGLFVAALLLFVPVPVQAGGVVGTGTAGTCTAAKFHEKLAGGGMVTFDCGAAPLTIILTATEVITSDTMIQGGGVITLSGAGSVGLFDIVSGAVTLDGLGLENGNANSGGAIQNNGRLAVLNSVFLSNQSTVSGGALTNLNQAAITNTFFLSNTTGTNGGGIYNLGQLVVNQTTFTRNSTAGLNGTGGGISQGSSGSALVMNSTFDGNGASAGGGGMAVSSTATISNSTFWANHGFLGDGLLAMAPASVSNSSFVGNDTFGVGNSIAGVFTVTVKNTILTGIGGTGSCAGFITSLGHNIDDGNTCGLSATGDMTNTNPLVGSLADNGGPTETVALLAGSPAINHGDNLGCPATDQRGYERVGGCDIGAFEYVFRVFVPAIKK